MSERTPHQPRAKLTPLGRVVVAGAALAVPVTGVAIAENVGSTPLGAQIMEGMFNGKTSQGVSNVTLYPGLKLVSNPEYSDVTNGDVSKVITKEQNVKFAVEYTDGGENVWLGVPVQHGKNPEIEGWFEQSGLTATSSVAAQQENDGNRYFLIGENSGPVNVTIEHNKFHVTPNPDGFVPGP